MLRGGASNANGLGDRVDIRSWRDTDTDWWVRLRLEWQPTMGEEQLRLLAAGRIAQFAHRAVAWDGGDRVGFASVARPPGHTDDFALVLVPPAYRSRGVGSALFADLLRAVSVDTLATAIPDDDPRSREIAEHWGFRVASHAIRSRLDIPAGQSPPPGRSDPLIRVIDALSPPFDRRWLSTLILDSDTSPEAVELGWRVTLESLDRMFPETVWVVIEQDGRPVAAASACQQDGTEWLLIYTCVLPGRRGEGLARLAKSHLHAVVSARGGRTLITDNEARNTAILRLNESLGYRRIGGEIRLRREQQSRGSS